MSRVLSTKALNSLSKYKQKKCPINTTAVLGNHNLTSYNKFLFHQVWITVFRGWQTILYECPPDLLAHRRARAVAAHTGVPVSGRVDFLHLANNCQTIRQMTFSLGHRHSLTLQDHFSQTKGIQPVPHLDPKFKVPCNKNSFSFYLRQVLKQFFPNCSWRLSYMTERRLYTLSALNSSLPFQHFLQELQIEQICIHSSTYRPSSYYILNSTTLPS